MTSPGAGAGHTSLTPGYAWLVVISSAGAVAVGQGFSRFSYGLLLPAMVRDLIGSYSLAGTFGTINLGAYLIGMLTVSLVSSRIQPVRLILGGLVGTLSGMVLLGFAQGLTMLFVGMTVMGLFAAGIWVPTTALVGSVMPARMRGLALGAVVAGPGLSVVGAGQLATLVRSVVDEEAWREVWLLQFAIGLAVLAAVTVVLRRVPDVHIEPGTFALRILRRMPRWWAATVAYAGFGLAYMIFITYLVAALETDAGFSGSAASLMYSLVGATSIVGGLILGRFSDRLGRKRSLIMVFTLAAAASVGVINGTQPVVGLSAVAFGLAMTGTGAVMAALIGDHLTGGSVGAAFGMLTAVFSVMQGLAPQLGGWLADQTGSFTSSILVAGAAFVVAAVFAMLLPSDHAGTRRGSHLDVGSGT